MRCERPLKTVGIPALPTMPQEFEMNPMHVLAGVVAVLLLIYLVVAMLKPEIFP
jgi:K+-transporting ATPase KdpF subunit